MSTCFVMQPFDGDVYDKRYETVFAPAIKAANLEPYRVDHDPSVSVPIASIEKGIRSAQLCFAEITMDNPNVWFELGFAIAAEKDVVMVCSEERKTNFPFDVQHRTIITYRTGAPQDFDELRGKITTRIKALLAKQGEISKASSMSPIQNTGVFKTTADVIASAYAKLVEFHGAVLDYTQALEPEKPRAELAQKVLENARDFRRYFEPLQIYVPEDTAAKIIKLFNTLDHVARRFAWSQAGEKITSDDRSNQMAKALGVLLEEVPELRKTLEQDIRKQFGVGDSPSPT